MYDDDDYELPMKTILKQSLYKKNISIHTFKTTTTTTVILLLMMIPGDFANTLKYRITVAGCFFRKIQIGYCRAKIKHILPHQQKLCCSLVFISEMADLMCNLN